MESEMSMSWTASRNAAGTNPRRLPSEQPPADGAFHAMIILLLLGGAQSIRGRNWVTNFGRLGIRSLGLLWSTMGARLPVQFTRFCGKGSTTLANWVRGQRENGFRGGGGFHGYP
ncbi:hypothetical protein NPIL_146531 [Nephila pilipes]|uniref:Uncharacterized protein n=1 Tax=Nephila pilipes TaxID=299642 RepID=A0A8X6UA87_NEPPI|nr:hypothetical protein NPIL_146531 [Nephila pilipes]